MTTTYRAYALSDSVSVGASTYVSYKSGKLTPPANKIWYVRNVSVILYTYDENQSWLNNYPFLVFQKQVAA